MVGSLASGRWVELFCGSWASASGHFYGSPASSQWTLLGLLRLLGPARGPPSSMGQLPLRSLTMTSFALRWIGGRRRCVITGLVAGASHPCSIWCFIFSFLQNLSNKILLNAVKEFSPLKLRIGGSLQDKVIYGVDPQQPCTPFVKKKSEMFGFSQGCLPMHRWDELNGFLKKAGAVIIFGLNALNGRVHLPGGSLGGPWNSTNAASFIHYTVNKGYTIHGWELGLWEMGGALLRLLGFCFWAFLWLSSFVAVDAVGASPPAGASKGTAVVDGTTAIAVTDDDFVCATLDWWPPEKCDYGTCSWGLASVLNLNLSNKILLNAVKEFSPLKLRIGGSLQDKVIYGVDPQQPCTPFVKKKSEMFGFSQGCLPMHRWDELNGFFKKAGAVIIFGLNALNGRVHLPGGSLGGPWNSTNAASFIHYTVNKGYTIHGWELGLWEMGGALLRLLGFCFWAFLWLSSFVAVDAVGASPPAGASKGTAVVDGTTAIAVTDDDFVCATLDWWPPEKCDYGTCSWGLASVLNLSCRMLRFGWDGRRVQNLSNKILLNAVKEFSPLKLRIGGSLQDKVIYGVDPQQPCTPFVKKKSEMFGFSQGCLPMHRWDELNGFFKKAGAVIIFGLNALNGRVHLPGGSLGGPWNSTNAASFIHYTVNKGYTIHGWELGLWEMGGALLRLLGFCFWAFLWLSSFVAVDAVGASPPAGASKGTAVVDGTTAIAVTDDDFVCATLDWWPPEKCDYGTCSWGLASVLNLSCRMLRFGWDGRRVQNLSNKILLNAVKEFSPLKLRIGGSLQDKVIYGVDPQQPCTPFVKKKSEMFGFSQGCLPMHRWDELNGFFKKAGAVIIFGLNALNGRVHLPGGSLGGPWNSTNAASFIHYTVNKGYTVHGWELGKSHVPFRFLTS
ncbi:uncharacterized protein LOC120104587 isoform X4 [Phoenix dactylifera]|uniref:Uncharacterized protein LOC120104587 isoform X4 n=1 Tax=Phoenix dactylifera TaxID=42345 RepID=A0A8B8ZJN2_PHODC|nr:uncharacterized protein LOC120104587 isoform X4 [Phoenix dactylifera]